MDTLTTTQPPFHLKTLNLPPPQPPPSVAELRRISAALSQFLRDYDDLHSHISSVNAALDEKLSVRFQGNAVNFNDSVKTVLEGPVIKLNPRRSVSECLLIDDDDDSNVLKGVVSLRKRSEGLVSDDSVLESVVLEQKRNKCLVDDDDDIRMHASSDSFINDSDGVVIDVSGAVDGTESDEGVKNCVVNHVLEGVVVTDGKCLGSVSESEYESGNYVKKREESDCERGDGNVRMSGCVKNDAEIMGVLVKMEESDSAEIIIDVSEALVSEQNLNGSESDHIVTEFGDARVSGQSSNSAASECEQGDDDVRIDESPNSPDSCKETHNKCAETDEEGEKLDAPKNVDETNYDPAISELLEEIDAIQKNDIRTASKCDNVRKPRSSSSLENSEETDDEDGEIEAPKEPEDADYDRIVTELLEDIDVVPISNRAAIDSDQSYAKPQSPNSLKNHLDEIDVLMNPEDKNHEQTDVSMETNVSEKHEELDILKNPAESDVSEKPEEIDTAKNPEEIDVSKKRKKADVSKKHIKADVSKKRKKADVSKKPEEPDVSEKPEYVEILKNPKPAVSELEMLCKSMSGREMKKYVVKHIFDIDKLRAELLKALKLAMNPAKLVLDSIGEYFLQSSKTYLRGSTQYLNDQIDGRQASVLILECFVMISGDGIEISREVEAYAAEAAKHWKTRMINEGGIEYRDEADARGLLLFISGFGINDRFFNTVDIMDLIRASNVKEISNILRCSIFLMPKIPEVINMMVMSKLEVEAADIAYTFGLEYKCHPLTILTKFLRSTIDDIESGSPVPKMEAMKQKLDDLKSVKKCLESHNIDPSKVLSEFKIVEEIRHLKKELKLPVHKLKAMGIESLPNPNHQEAKRTCFSYQPMPHDISSNNQSMQPGCSHNRDFNYIPPSLAGPSGNIWPNGWQDDTSVLVEKYLVQPYPGQSQTYDTQPSLTGLYGRLPGFPVCMLGRPGYPEYFPSGGFQARRGPRSDLYAFADVVEQEMRGSRAVGSGTGRSSYY